MKYLISVGHTASGTIGSGAVDLINESDCTREVAPLVVDKLKVLGHEAVLIRVDKSNSYKNEDCFVRSQQANDIGGDLFAEIHFNSGIGRKGDGAEVITISNSSLAQKSAKNISKCLSETLGISNRGVKNDRFIVLTHTAMPSMIIECMFVDGKNADVTYNAEKIANAIVEGLTGEIWGKYKTGWNKDEKGWWYADTSNTYLKNCWKQIDGYWYSFDENGYARKGWFKDTDGRWYYLNPTKNNDYPECSMLLGWLKYKDKMCYLSTGADKERDLYTGQCLMNITLNIDGTNYTFDKDGYLVQ